MTDHFPLHFKNEVPYVSFKRIRNWRLVEHKRFCMWSVANCSYKSKYLLTTSCPFSNGLLKWPFQSKNGLRVVSEMLISDFLVMILFMLTAQFKLMTFFLNGQRVHSSPFRCYCSKVSGPMISLTLVAFSRAFSRRVESNWHEVESGLKKCPLVLDKFFGKNLHPEMDFSLYFWKADHPISECLNDILEWYFVNTLDAGDTPTLNWYEEVLGKWSAK